jgi:hypothetical protein
MFERVISFLSTKKKQDTSSIEDTFKTISPGTVIKLKFKDPKKLGLYMPSGDITRRYDPEDLYKRILIGTLLTKRVVNGILFLELGCFKMRNGMRVERTYTLMVEEIEHVEEVK